MMLPLVASMSVAIFIITALLWIIYINLTIMIMTLHASFQQPEKGGYNYDLGYQGLLVRRVRTCLPSTTVVASSPLKQRNNHSDEKKDCKQY